MQLPCAVSLPCSLQPVSDSSLNWTFVLELAPEARLCLLS